MHIGIIGCGYWGQNYVRIFSQMPGIEKVTVCDLSPKQLWQLKQQFPNITTTADYLDILKNTEISAVIISSPTNTHYSIAKQALEAGKDILVEKPVAQTLKEVETLNDAAKSTKKILMAGFTFGYHMGIRKIRALIEAEELGQIYYLTATRTHLGLIREDVNVVWDLAPHDIFIFSYLLQVSPLQVSAVGSSYLNGKEDVAFITLTYPGKIVGHIQVSWMDAHKVREIVVVGSKKRVHFNDIENLEKIRISEKGASVERSINDYGEYQLQLRDGDIIIPKVELKEPLRLQCQHFIECVTTRSSPLTNGKYAIENVSILTAIDESIKKNGEPVKITPIGLVPSSF